MYKIINMEQGSSEWHEFRSNHIGGSDAPIIMGLSPWSTESQLWALKMGFSEPVVMTDRMKRGQDLEPLIREWHIKESGINYTPIVLESTVHPFMSASLDGIDDDYKSIIEIKYPNEKTHNMALHGVIPDYYLCQIQHCLFVSGCEGCKYITYGPESHDKYAKVWVSRDENYFKFLIEKEKKFWDCVLNQNDPGWKLKVKK